MPRGSRPGERRGGRQKGTPNRKTAEAQASAARTAEAIAEVIPQAFEGDAHALLMMVYKDPALPIETRMEAAGKAIRFEKPALSNVEAKVTQTIQDLREEDLDAEIRAAASAAGLLAGATEH